MSAIASIITVGISPCWDLTCYGGQFQWGEHKVISHQELRPAGKALNISRALAWSGEENTAAGLWGKEDYEQLRSYWTELSRYTQRNFTVVPGKTRQNVTLVDTQLGREMHLRSASDLACPQALKKIAAELKKMVRSQSICVFAGALPAEPYLETVVEIIQSCHNKGARIVVDTQGQALAAIMAKQELWLIKPNLQELSDLVGYPVDNHKGSICRAAHSLLDRVEMILVSRGPEGALLVTSESTWHGYCPAAKTNALCTVGCGDYLLAGFLKGLLRKQEKNEALRMGLKFATAKAWNQTEEMKWSRVQRKIKVEIEHF